LINPHSKIENNIDRAAINGRKVKILCRNSYERKCDHEYAEKKNLSHRSIIDYTQYHINQKVETFSGAWDFTCEEYTIKLSATPYSFVEINNGVQKEIIGNQDMLPKDKVIQEYGEFSSDRMDRALIEFRV
jgi:hypothetical protein